MEPLIPGSRDEATMDRTSIRTSSPQPRDRGYSRLASLMSETSGFLILRKFSYLNCLNLLRLQADLCHLQQELWEIQQEEGDDTADVTIDTASNFRLLRESGETLEYKKLEEIGQKLNEYNTALTQLSAIDQLPVPSGNNYREFKKWLDHWGGVGFPPTEENAYAEPQPNDQITLRSENPGSDPILSYLQGPGVNIIDSLRGRFRSWSPAMRWKRQNQAQSTQEASASGGDTGPKRSARKRGIWAHGWSWNSRKDVESLGMTNVQDRASEAAAQGTVCEDRVRMSNSTRSTTRKPLPNHRRVYDFTTLARISNAITAAVASLLPTVGILTLYFVRSMLVRIGMVIAFTAVFSATLALITPAKQHEIFAATAAFAAVEVIFIGSVVD